MSKLDPKPAADNPLKNWDDLNSLLKANFKDVPVGGSGLVMIKTADYQMSPKDIIAEATSSGYTASEEGEFIRFT